LKVGFSDASLFIEKKKTSLGLIPIDILFSKTAELKKGF
jgi:hypothetical protein